MLDPGVIVVPPVPLTTSPVTPGGLWSVWTWRVLFVNASDGVKVGPEVTVRVPPAAAPANPKNTARTVKSERERIFME